MSWKTEWRQKARQSTPRKNGGKSARKPRHKHPAGNHAFVIAAPGTPGATVEYLLRTYGVQMVGGWSPTGGRWVEQDGTIHFVVRASQARWTTHILSRAGYAILEGATSDGVARADGTLPVPWGRAVGPRRGRRRYDRSAGGHARSAVGR